MGSAFRAGMTLLVISLLFLALNLVWDPNYLLPNGTFPKKKSIRYPQQRGNYLPHLKAHWICITSIPSMRRKKARH